MPSRRVFFALWCMAAVAAPLLFAADTPGSGLPKHETLDYDIEWRLFTAGKAQLNWSAAPGDLRKGWEIKLGLESLGVVSRLFHVNDQYSASLNSDLCAASTFMTAHEGSRNRETHVTYADRKAGYLERDLNRNSIVLKKEIETPACVHDLIGGLYVLRAMNLEPGRSAEIPVSNGKKSVLLKVEAQRREEIRVPAGPQKTILYEVYAFNNVLYSRAGHLRVWLTDDARRLPVQVQIRLQFTVGTITLRLNKAQ